MQYEDEYELVPLGPIGRLERRLEKMERSNVSGETLKELVDIVKVNQHVVDDIVRVNSDMITKVTELSNSVHELANRISDFMSRLEVASGTEGGLNQEVVKEITSALDERLRKLEKRLDTIILSSMARRPQPMQPRPQLHPI